MKFKTRNKDFFFLGIKVFRGIKGKNVAKKDGSCSFGSTLSLPLSPHLIFILLCVSADKITSFPRFYITEKPHTETDSALSSQSKFFLGQKNPIIPSWVNLNFSGQGVRVTQRNMAMQGPLGANGGISVVSWMTVLDVI